MQLSKGPIVAILSVLTTFQLQALATSTTDQALDIPKSGEYNPRFDIHARDMTDIPSAGTDEPSINARNDVGDRGTDEAGPSVENRADKREGSGEGSNTAAGMNEEKKRKEDNEENHSKRDGEAEAADPEDVYDLYDQDDLSY